MFPKHARLPTRQRLSAIPYCGKKKKNNNANNVRTEQSQWTNTSVFFQQRKNSNEPRRLTQESIKALGGLKNAKSVIDKHEENSRGERSTCTVPRKYRKKKKSSDERAAEQARLEEEERENSHDMYQNHYGSSNHKKPSILLIDGYNLLFEMKRKDEKQFEGLEIAQARFKMEGAILAFIQGLRTRVVIVYDALNNPNKDEESNGLDKDTNETLELIFCQNYEADKGISLMCEQYLKEGTPEITVITSDRSVRQNCSKAPLVHCKSSKIFLKDIHNRNREIQDKIDEHNLNRNRNFLGGTLSNETRSELSQIRRKLN